MFEGDGAISAVRITPEAVTGAHRVIAGPEYCEERRRGKPLFGLNAPWWRRISANLVSRVKNTANTSVMTWQGRLFALMEAAKPIEISQADLQTGSEMDFGVIPGTFSAHPHRVAARNTLYNFGLRYGRTTFIDLFELPDCGPARLIHSIPLKFPVMLHDFIATDKHLIFLISPANIRVFRALASLPPFEKIFRRHPREGTEVVVVPIDEPDRLRRFHTEPFFQFHFANAFESGDEIVVDFIRYNDLTILARLGGDNPTPTMADGADSAFVRARINPQTTSFCPEIRGQLCEFPQVHPSRMGRSYQYAWMVEQSGQPEGPDPDADQLVCLDVEAGSVRRYQFGGGRRTSEPIFVPRSKSGAEDDGHILSLVFDPDSQTSHIAVFDSQRFEDGPQARLWFDHHVPTTFHGVWVPSST